MDTLVFNKAIDSLQINRIAKSLDSLPQNSIHTLKELGIANVTDSISSTTNEILPSLDNLYQDTASVIHEVQVSNLINNTPAIIDEIGISVIVSIIIFILGFIINGKIHKSRKRKELKLYKFTIDIWWKKNKSFVNDYISSLYAFSTEIKNNNSFNIAKWRTNLIHLSKFASIPIDKATSVFVIDLKTKDKLESAKHMVNFFNQLEYMEKIINVEVKSLYNEYANESKSVMDEWNIQYMGLLEYTQKTPKDLLSEPEEHCMRYLVSKISPLLARQAKDEQIGPNEWNESFIKPCMYYIASYNNGVLLKMRHSQHIANYLKALQIVILRHDKLNYGFNILFAEYSENMRKANSIIDDSINYLNKYQIK